MLAGKRILLILLFVMTFMFTGYQLYLIISPLSAIDSETKYVHLVEQYQVLKMQRLVLEQKYALEQTKRRIAQGQQVNFALNVQHPTAKIPIALSLAQTKTFEQLEAYVSNNKPLQPQILTKDEKFILQAPADDFTLQLMGVRDANELTRFISENKLSDAQIIHTYYLNKDWYVLVSGLYKNHTQALKAIDTLPRGIKDLKPWIRQISSLQKAIQLYRN